VSRPDAALDPGRGARLLALRPVRFAVVGACAVSASLAVFVITRQLGATGVVPTALRLLVALPILYAGYSRWMLRDLLDADRARRGPRIAELRMVARVGAAVAASTVAKLVIEPWLVADLERRGAAAWADLAPLAGDLVYGPGLAYAVLAAGQVVRSASHCAVSRSSSASSAGTRDASRSMRASSAASAPSPEPTAGRRLGV
jgi:hypothetical protein